MYTKYTNERFNKASEWCDRLLTEHSLVVEPKTSF